MPKLCGRLVDVRLVPCRMGALSVLELVDAGIRVNSEEYIRWAADVDTPFTRRMRVAELLA